MRLDGLTQGNAVWGAGADGAVGRSLWGAGCERLTDKSLSDSACSMMPWHAQEAYYDGVMQGFAWGVLLSGVYAGVIFVGGSRTSLGNRQRKAGPFSHGGAIFRERRRAVWNIKFSSLFSLEGLNKRSLDSFCVHVCVCGVAEGFKQHTPNCCTPPTNSPSIALY